ncbi:MAG: MoxR family ATPase [Bdellovibrio sp.]|nr:MoxR family ATPase [Bdellovibrio sp.]
MEQKHTDFVCIGRHRELSELKTCIQAQKNILLEGPVGVGKTHLALSATKEFQFPVFRIDGDSRYTEQKLTGWFDPPTVLKKGYSEDTFFPGPLVEAMKSGGILFINELNRLPEGVQNILLPAIDEKVVYITKIGWLKAKPGFLVIATQNPKEFVATSHLSEAILDRFELIVIDYQSEEEEIEITKNKCFLLINDLEAGIKNLLPKLAVRLCRMTRSHSKVKRGASVRAAISIVELCCVFLKQQNSLDSAFLKAALLALPTRIELEHEIESQLSLEQEMKNLIKDCVEKVLDGDENELKKKS